MWLSGTTVSCEVARADVIAVARLEKFAFAVLGLE
jgi:hypothetical protein